MKNRYIIIVILVFCFVFLSGCSFKNLDMEYYNSLVTEMLESIENDDFDAIRSHISDDISDDDLMVGIKEIQDRFEGEINGIIKTGIYYNKHVNVSESSELYTIYYLVNTDVDNYAVVMQILFENGGAPKVAGFNVLPADEAYDQGNILDFNNFHIAQPILIIWSIISIGLVVWSLVLCIKAKIKYKALWILALLVFHMGFTVTKMPDIFRFRVLFLSIGYSNLRTFLNGGLELTVLLPAGAILFLILRKSLIRSVARNESRKALQSGDAEQQNDEESNYGV